MTGLHLVAMPKWGLSMEEGQVVAWHKRTGDTIEKGEDLADVETTKITNTVEAPAAGRLLSIIAENGTTIACGAPLAVIGTTEATDEQVALFVAQYGRQGEAHEIGAAARPEPVVRSVAGRDGTIRIRYLDIGAGDETLVLIHGFGGDLENWMFNQPALAAGMRVIALDLPGHGGSDKTVPDGSAAALATSVAALLHDIVPETIHLVGHSFGAMVAREIAVTRPDRIASFTAIAPADLGRVDRRFIDGFVDARRRSELTAAIAMLFARPELATREMAEALLRYKRLDGVEQALRSIDAANLTGFGPDPAARAFWNQLGARGLLLWGARDAIVPIASAEIDFAGITTNVIEDVGHMPHLEAFERVNAAIAAHVDAHRQDRS